MTLSKMLTASLLGVAALSSGALAQSAKAKYCEKVPDAPTCKDFAGDTTADPPIDESSPVPQPQPGPEPEPEKCPPGESKAVCYTFAIGGSSTGGNNITEAAGNAAAYMCGDGEGSATAIATAEATATLFAKAVAEASATCEVCGDAKGYADAYAKATAVAEGWLVAYAEAFAAASVCNQCDAFAESWGYVEEYVFLKAVAEANATVNSYESIDNNLKFSETVFDYNEEVKEAVATAFAEAIARAAIYYDGNECFAWVNTNGCIYSPEAEDPELCFECVASSASVSFIYEIPAIATAGDGAAAITCGPESFAEADTHVVATALAEATVVAISNVFISCEADKGAYVCADAGSFIEDAAHTVAAAFAESWALALDCKEDCVVSVETATEAFGEVLATAASSAYGSVCIDGGEHFTLDAVKIVVETQLLEAVAEAGALAISSVDEHGDAVCFAASFADAAVSPTSF